MVLISLPPWPARQSRTISLWRRSFSYVPASSNSMSRLNPTMTVIMIVARIRPGSS
jgi:hypothetical protein